MAFFVYIIYSEKKDQFYIGQSDNIENRLVSHNSGKSQFTSTTNDWKLVYSEIYETRAEVRKRELEIKNKKSRKYIEFLIKNNA